MSELCKIIPFPERPLSPERRAALMNQITDIAIEISLLESRKEQLEEELQRGQ